MSRRSRGFTLIELLVVIAIIGILAAMLFPVFARARESARKTQCLANVKNIALAVNMYLGDWEAFPPTETRVDVINYFVDRNTTDCPFDGRGAARAYEANPYLRWPVLLDDYVKNRDVWGCPSARVSAPASFILPMGPNGNWLAYLQANEDAWGETVGFGPCSELTYPSGWGGEITDSIAQGQSAGLGDNMALRTTAERAFVMGLSVPAQNFLGMRLAAINETASTPVVADGGLHSDFLSMGTMSYPDICCAECSGIQPMAWGGTPTDPCCTNADEWCDPDCYVNHARYAWATTPDLQKATARHLGGPNVGFADGHAKWFSARALIAMADEGTLKKVGWICDPITSADGYEAECGPIPAGTIFLHKKSLGWEGNP